MAKDAKDDQKRYGLRVVNDVSLLMVRIVCRLRKIVDYMKKDCILVGTKYGNRARNNMDKKAFFGIPHMSHYRQ